ncbi:hypothetical protein BCU33_005645 [Vibrio lentus]|nr:hypothetical protein [Vibrio lentus]PMI95994.1 hypothetical protein BCU33_15030 [Vibrio lentus]
MTIGKTTNVVETITSHMHQLELDLIGGENPTEVPLKQKAIKIESDADEVTKEIETAIQLELELKVT